MVPLRFLFLTVALAVAVLAFIPGYAPLPDAFSYSDILNHFAAFFVLYVLHVWAYPSTTPLQRIGLLIAYGALIEGVQYFLPTRDASLNDLAVDAAALLSAAVSEPLYRLWPYRFAALARR